MADSPPDTLPWYLAEVVEVAWEDRVPCQCRDCGRGVYKAVHLVVWSDGRIETWGSTCYKRELGAAAAQHAVAPRFGQSGVSRRLTAAERDMLANNREALIAWWRQEHEAALARQRRAAEAERRRELAEQRAAEHARQREAETAAARNRQREVEHRRRAAEAREAAAHRPPDRIPAAPHSDPLFQFIFAAVCDSYRQQGVDPTTGSARTSAMETASFRYHQCRKLGIDPRQSAG